MTTHDLRSALDLLALERHAAHLSGLAGNARYMDDLDADVEAAHAAYVGAAVTEIATLRGALSGRLEG